MVAAVDHGLQVQVPSAVVEGLSQHVVSIAQRIFVVQNIVFAPGLSPHSPLCGVAVHKVEVATLQVEHQQVVAVGIDFRQIPQQLFVILHAPQLLLRPAGHVGSLGNDGDGRVGSTQMPLVAVPVDAVAQPVGHVDNRA